MQIHCQLKPNSVLNENKFRKFDRKKQTGSERGRGRKYPTDQCQK